VQVARIHINLERIAIVDVLGNWLVSNYLIFKSLHIISVISLMAGLLYLPRLFVYHTQAKPGGELCSTLKIMEKKLLKIIINPALIATFIFGALLLMAPGMNDFKAGWFHGKLFLVVCLSITHIMMVRWQRDFEQGRNKKSGKFFRIMNEIPTVLMIVITFLVILKPF
jgi:putative membrane protein